MSSDGGVFNNAAQIWNHTFLLELDEAQGRRRAKGDLAAAITRDFGSFAKFKRTSTAAATTQFGSGWAWLVLDGGKLKVTKTGNADLPMKAKQKALLTSTCGSTPTTRTFRPPPKYIETFLTSLATGTSLRPTFAAK